MTVPEAMLDQRLRRYRLRRHRLHCAGGMLSVVAPARGDDLLAGDAGVRCLRAGQMPYWAEIWPASVGIARRLMRGPSLAGRRVMDLGCGIGIAGLAAATRGAEVWFVDRVDDALHFAAFNARHVEAPVHQVQLDWFEATADGRYDLLLLADVAYEERNFAPLRRHLRGCLRPAGHALLGDPYRVATSHFIEGLAPEFAIHSDRVETSFGGERFELRLATISAVTSSPSSPPGARDSRAAPSPPAPGAPWTA
jgi:SAM-dependent methyltransferase